MTDDDDLRDGFGGEITDALRARSQVATTVIPVDTVNHRVNRVRNRRRLLAAAVAALIGAGGTAVIALHAHGTTRLNVSSHSSTTVRNPPSFNPVATGVADWTWVSADHGWALVRERCGETVCMSLRETTDGGRTWASLRTPRLLDTHAQYDASTTCATNLCVSGVRFETSKIGWLFGPAFLETTNGGRTWTRVPGPDVTDVEVSEDVALRLTSNSVTCDSDCTFDLEREDVGSGAWRRVTDAVSGNPSVLILRSDAYLVSGPDPLRSGHSDLRRSHDQGATWTTIPDPCAGNGDHVTTSASEAPDAVFVVLCSARDQPTSPFVRISGDGGKTFGARHNVPIDSFGEVRAASAHTLLVGTATRVMVSSDGGATWRTTLTASSARGGRVALGWENPQTARVSFDTEAIWTTRNAGSDWTRNPVTP